MRIFYLPWRIFRLSLIITNTKKMYNTGLVAYYVIFDTGNGNYRKINDNLSVGRTD